MPEATPSQPPTEREIFRFRAGEKTRYADPLVVEDAWGEAMDEFDAEAFEQQLDSPIRQAKADANRKFLGVICKAFGVTPLDPETGEGMTTRELLDLSDRFWSWRESLKKNTDAPPATAPPSAAGSTTSTAGSSSDTASTSTSSGSTPSPRSSSPPRSRPSSPASPRTR